MTIRMVNNNSDLATTTGSNMSVEYDYDVVIIGGGPAGSTVARYVAQSGVSVIVVDSRESIGSPLQCGELVPTNDEMRRLCPNVPDMDDLFKTPESAISKRTEVMKIITPSGKSLEFDFEGLVLNRVAHDEALVELAKQAGAEYKVGCFVNKIEGNSVFIRIWYFNTNSSSTWNWSDNSYSFCS